MSFETSTASSPEADDRVDPDSGWRDRLVELHVLAEHGDQAAIGEAQQWISTDERARTAWQEIDATCARLRDG